MAGEAQLQVLISAQDNASPQLKGLTNTLADSRGAIRELAMGTTMLGASFMAMGVAMEQSNNKAEQGIGHMLMMGGAIMTAIGSTVQFVSAISRTIDALQKLAASEILVQALSNPLFLVLGLAAGAGIIAGVSAMNKSENKVNVTVNNNIDSKQMANSLRSNYVITAAQNAGTSGIK